MLKLHFIFLCATTYVLLSDRIFLKVASGGRGVLPLMPIVVILLGGAFALLARQREGTLFLDPRGNWLYWFPYLLLATILPVLGIAFTGYPVRTLFSIVPGLVDLSFLVLGSWLAASGATARQLATKYLFLAIMVEFLFAAIQFAHMQGYLSSGSLNFLYRWDLSTQVAYSKTYIITARSVGTYINPNDLGFWSVIAFWGGVHMLRGVPRMTAVLAALATLALSQSRGSLMALLGSVLVWLVYLAFSRDKTLRQAFDATFALLLGSILAIGVASTFWRPAYLPSRMEQRFARGLGVITGGVAMDPNAQGRVNAWMHALQFYQHHPLGTFGEPQLLFGGFIDNDLVHILLQGGPVFLIAILLALGAGILLIGCGSLGTAIGTWSAAILLNAMTANPLTYASIGLYWLAVGYYLANRERLKPCQNSCLPPPLRSL